MNSGIVRTASTKEDLFSNPFYEYLRQNHEELLVSAIQREPPSVLVVPSSQALAGISKSVYQSKRFAESHILFSAHIPGLFCSVRGSPVEFRNDRLILTVEGTKHVCPVTSTESIYDFGNSFKVLVVDKPLLHVASDESGASAALASGKSLESTTRTGGGPSEYLAAVPLIETDFIEKVSKLRRSFLLVPGYEGHLALRIKEMSTIAANQVVRYLPAPTPTVGVVQQDIERAVYATLHAWIYPHIQSAVESKTLFGENLRKPIMLILRELEAPSALLSNISGVESAVKSEICPIFQKLMISITPQQKINGIVAAQERIGDILKTRFQIPSPGAEEILALLTSAIVLSNHTQGIADLAYCLMFLHVHEDLRSSKAAFAVTTFSTCIEFLSTAVL